MLNIANIITMFRIIIAIPFLILFNYENEISQYLDIDISWSVLFISLIFTFTMFTDIFDGLLARELKMVTVLGKILDPLADKIMVVGALLLLLEKDFVSFLPIFLILMRELFVTSLRVIMIENSLDVGASYISKIKTILQTTTVVVLILRLERFGTLLLWITVILTLYSMLGYIKVVYNHYKDNR